MKKKIIAKEVFQFLIGRLKNPALLSVHPRRRQFQFLIGRLKNTTIYM